MGVIRILFFMVVVYYLARFISRVLMPYFRAVTEINERQKAQQPSPRAPYTAGKAAKKPRPIDGDYVDYQEVE